MRGSVRARRAGEIIRNLAAEGLRVEHADMLMLKAYIRRAVTGIDMLNHVLQFTTADEYHDWLLEHQATHADVSRSRVSVKQVLREFENYVKRRHVAAKSGRRCH